MYGDGGVTMSAGEFALPSWMDAMSGATLLLAVVGNNTQGADPAYVGSHTLLATHSSV